MPTAYRRGIRRPDLNAHDGCRRDCRRDCGPALVACLSDLSHALRPVVPLGSPPDGASGRHGTRGTTNTNRLRRVDRWIAAQPALLHATDPFVVDLGYGASGVTTPRARHSARARAPRRRSARPRDRPCPGGGGTGAARAGASRATVHSRPTLRLDFALGGFEVPTPGDRRPAIIRAFNVLRQYDESDVAAAWERMTSRLAPGGLLVEGTCDELGPRGELGRRRRLRTPHPHVCLRVRGSRRRRSSPSGCRRRSSTGTCRASRSMSCSRRSTGRGGCTRRCRSTVQSQRWIATVATVRHEGWHVIGGPRRSRLGELTVPWESVAPH